MGPRPRRGDSRPGTIRKVAHMFDYLLIIFFATCAAIIGTFLYVKLYLD